MERMNKRVGEREVEGEIGKRESREEKKIRGVRDWESKWKKGRHGWKTNNNLRSFNYIFVMGRTSAKKKTPKT